jgi:hypothetical protein
MYNPYYDSYDSNPENENQRAKVTEPQSKNRQETFSRHAAFVPLQKHAAEPVSNQLSVTPTPEPKRKKRKIKM